MWWLMAVTCALVAVLLICEPEANSAVNQSRILRIHHELLIGDTGGVVSSAAAFVGQAATFSRRKICAFAASGRVRHGIGGEPLRRSWFSPT